MGVRKLPAILMVVVVVGVLAVGSRRAVLAGESRATASAPASAPTPPLARSDPAVSLPDLRQPGPDQVVAQEYDFGDTAVRLPDLDTPVEMRGVVHRPVAAKGRTLPLVVFVHGLMYTCYDAGARQLSMEWPCRTGFNPVLSFRGYDYLAGNLASHGFIVVSISANGVNATDWLTDDLGVTARAHLVERHLRQLAAWNTTGGAPFGDALVAAIDPARVGLMGHSRGGGGVGRFMTLKPTTGFTVKAVLPLAPAAHGHDVITDTALAVVLATCDGDAVQLPGIALVDESRYARPGDTGPKYTVAIAGGNHNFFNTVWSPSAGWPGGRDDAASGPTGSVCRAGSPGRLDEAQQREYAVAYINGFFRYHLGAENSIAPLWTGAATPPFAERVVQVSRHPRDTADERLVINRLEADQDLTTNALDGAVSLDGLDDARICAKGAPVVGGGDGCLTGSRQVSSRSQPHHRRADLHLFKAAWTRSGGMLTNTVPASHENVSRYAAVQVRAALDFSDLRNPVGKDQAVAFTLTDAAGHSQTVTAAGPALAFPRLPSTPLLPGLEDLSPHFLLNQIREPLSSFTGVDLTHIRTVSIGFPGQSGSVGLSDLLLSN
jgi:hypothetical protein